MKISFVPRSVLGKWTVELFVQFLFLLGIFGMFIKGGERGGDTYFSNLRLTIPFTLAGLSSIISFFTGVISIIKNKERAVSVFLVSGIGFLVLLWSLAEVLFS